ncbi:hypothetical protein NEUTE1DRAFT_118258 [Neurospora tetrasperma FGSC 2508]|uniref:Uncharacterized protein n=1 Tax=Neurospora tetrasperma (strain FGSC 2508 / ATCC MYA-4615 / P0657) TaxID=510951 RepID=F8MUZ1_NEUT8|nr:uncharacterized protein NEUTE1DRAFT_118258 [Neurospora tetrasperma FGSC 2508]EGO54616.1 hypothetical protein NEUTE1DRAFT_118258 [Neurospora tetrasperma FGSC 2508]EGZ67928.1 hypothetical protein NEUTE2DRAFT_145774 [Neurospora tetrasperma FGSC 2509]
MECRSVCETGPPFLGRGRVQHNFHALRLHPHCVPNSAIHTPRGIRTQIYPKTQRHLTSAFSFFDAP